MGFHKKIKRNSKSLEIVQHWNEPYHKIGYLYFIIWDLIVIAFCSHVFVDFLRGEFDFPVNIFVFLGFFALIPLPNYWMLLFLINKTKVKLTRTEVLVQNGPLPCLRKDHSFYLNDIKNIWIKEHLVNKSFQNSWQLKADQTCNLITSLKNGESISIIENIQTPEEAHAVLAQIKSWLRETNRIKLVPQY